jgi:hypothetical protein
VSAPQSMRFKLLSQFQFLSILIVAPQARVNTAKTP